MSDVEWAEIDDSVDDWEFAEILEESAHVAANLQEHTAVDDLKHTYANFAADMREAAARIRRLRERTDTGEARYECEWADGCDREAEVEAMLCEEHWQMVENRGRTDVRESVMAMAVLMETELRKHDATKGRRGWDGYDPLALVRRLEEEAHELRECVDKSLIENGGAWFPPRASEVGREAADVANMAMMVADVCGGLAQGRSMLRTSTGEGEQEVGRCPFCREVFSLGQAKSLAGALDEEPADD